MSTLFPESLMEKIDNSPNVLAIRARFEPEAELRGELRGEAKAILTVLKTRSIALSDEQRERIAQCTEPKLIERWLERGVTATTMEDVFRD